jgi:glycosyltransferase involved in cell wall biosynthesis
MSGIYLEAAKYAKQQYGAKIWLERGSRHILSQDEILKAIPGAERPSAFIIDRELKGYSLADKIVIPSNHVQESFRVDAEAHAKLFINPYGVDLSMFPKRKTRAPNEPLIFLFVGSWSLRKGCDVLSSAISQLRGVRLVHVGNITDLAFPINDARFVHHDPVPQQGLQHYYADADAFVLASREEGFGVVLSQALASLLPVICTDRTGGPDVAHTPSLLARIKVVPHDNIEALASAMASLRDTLYKSQLFPPLSEGDLETLTWKAYAHRYNRQLLYDFEKR